MTSNGFIDNGVTCGNCKGKHANAAEVKVCFLEAKEAQASAQVPATEKQEAFLRKLAGEREHGWADAEAVIAGTITSRAATSAAINLLLAAPKVQAAKASVVDLEDGVYRHDSTFYKVYHTVHGANVQVAKVLVVTPNGQDANGNDLFGGTWEYVGRKPLYSLTPAHKLTQDEAKQFGLVYGMCVRCARDLTREESIHVGYGATCAAHEGWWYPTKSELKALLLVDPKATAVEPKATPEPAWKAQVAQAEQEAMEDYANEPF